MADISKINVNNTTYTIKDSGAVRQITESGTGVYGHTGPTQTVVPYSTTLSNSTTTLITGSAVNNLILYCGSSTVNIFDN